MLPDQVTSQETKPKTEIVLNAYVSVRGIRNRCRTIDTHNLDLGDFPVDANHEEIINLALAKAKESMKRIDRISLHLNRHTLRHEGDMVSRSFAFISNDRVNYDLMRKLVESLKATASA